MRTMTETATAPAVTIDPFAMAFFADPHPAHEVLREAGPVVYLPQWKIYAVARYAEVHRVLHDPQTFCSSRGAGLSDFAKRRQYHGDGDDAARRRRLVLHHGELRVGALPPFLVM